MHIFINLYFLHNFIYCLCNKNWGEENIKAINFEKNIKRLIECNNLTHMRAIMGLVRQT